MLLCEAMLVTERNNDSPSLTKLKFNVISNILAGKSHLLVQKYKDGEIKKLCSNQYTSILQPPLTFFP